MMKLTSAKAIFVITTSLIVVIGLRNSLIWHLNKFWGASGNLFSTVWAFIYHIHEENEFVMWVPATIVLSNIVFIVVNGFFIFVDLTGRPSFMLQYKIQQDKNVPVNWIRYKKALMLATFNNTIVATGFSLAFYQLIKWRGNSCGYELPSFSTTIIDFLAFLIFDEIGIYYTHRLVHHRLLYKHIHKIHHEWTAPVGIVSLYCHPIEHFVVDMMPVALGPLVMGSHLSVVWLWYVWTIITTTLSHAGYHLPFMPSAEAHDYHHLKFNQNYGALGLLDRLHGTDQIFRRSQEYKRHIMLLGLTPVRQLVPETKKKSVLTNNLEIGS